MKIKYVSRRFSSESQGLIDYANDIIERYGEAGYTLTLRQLYYQLVAAAIIENTERSYKRIGSIINDARLAGLIDWEAIEDRTRFIRSLAHWPNPSAIVGACAEQFRVDMWADQPWRVECWVEKDALVGVFEPVCNKYDVPLLSCRGYVSQSEMWVAGQRINQYREANQQVAILHFGDHDPSGIDMSRDIAARLKTFAPVDHVEDIPLLPNEDPDFYDEDDGIVRRVALTMTQIKEVKPPPNPAKADDSRCAGYVAKYGHSSWELDALKPEYLSALVAKHVAAFIDTKKWEARKRLITKGRKAIAKIAKTL